MASKNETYVAHRDFTIEQTKFTAGDIVGTGNVEAGEFTADKSCPNVGIGHVVSRLRDGRIVVASDPAKKTGK